MKFYKLLVKYEDATNAGDCIGLCDTCKDLWFFDGELEYLEDLPHIFCHECFRETNPSLMTFPIKYCKACTSTLISDGCHIADCSCGGKDFCEECGKEDIGVANNTQELPTKQSEKK